MRQAPPQMLAPSSGLENGLSELRDEVRRFVGFVRHLPPDPWTAMHDTIAHMHALCAALTITRSIDITETKRALLPAIEVHRESPFVRRLCDWPRGYPGDFETVEILMT